jgi:hypothetical protein
MSACCQYATDVPDEQWEVLQPLLPVRLLALRSKAVYVHSFRNELRALSYIAPLISYHFGLACCLFGIFYTAAARAVLKSLNGLLEKAMYRL